jgi:alpha-tubulin suppressor-like RCC1 family protein
VTADSTAVCWGRNREGQLGTGSASTIATTTPAPVAGGLRLVDIAAGEHTTCGVDAQGAGWCWGNNVSGQVGDSSRTQREAPSRVRFAGRFRTIQVGTQTSCGLATDGAVHCWGRTSRRAAGVDGPFADSITTTPVRVPLPVPTQSLGYGLATGCAVGTDGVVRCWGLNTQGGAGPRTSPQCVNSPFGEALCLPNVVAVPPMAQVSVGALHTCGRATDGLLWCWGWNHRMQIAPRVETIDAPQSIQVP